MMSTNASMYSKKLFSINGIGGKIALNFGFRLKSLTKNLIAISPKCGKKVQTPLVPNIFYTLNEEPQYSLYREPW